MRKPVTRVPAHEFGRKLGGFFGGRLGDPGGIPGPLRQGVPGPRAAPQAGRAASGGPGPGRAAALLKI